MWTNAVVQLVVMTLSWLVTGIIHILFVPALNQRLEDLENECNAPLPEETEGLVNNEDSEPVVDDAGRDWD
jgi:hypothetical protein